MNVDFTAKRIFIIEIVKENYEKFLTPREIGNKYHERFFLPRAIVIVEPARHVHKALKALSNEGLIKRMGKGSSIRYGIGKTMRTPITLQARFIDYYIKNSLVPKEEWLTEPERAIIKGIDFRIVQKLSGSFVHLILYFPHHVKLKKEATIGTVCIVKPRSHKFPKGKL